MSHESVVRLFVYGSLQRGEANHAELGGASFVARAHTAPRYALREIAGYAALVSGELTIEGELFELPRRLLSALDEFEGQAYVRREIELADGSSASAYLARDECAGRPLSASSWTKRK